MARALLSVAYTQGTVTVCGTVRPRVYDSGFVCGLVCLVGLQTDECCVCAGHSCAIGRSQPVLVLWGERDKYLCKEIAYPQGLYKFNRIRLWNAS